MTPVVVPLIAGIGPPEIILILLVLVLLFGAKKLPELARGSGRALRIFKAETKGLIDDESDGADGGKFKTEEQRQIDAQRSREAAQRVETQPEPQVEPRPEQVRPDTER